MQKLLVTYSLAVIATTVIAVLVAVHAYAVTPEQTPPAVGTPLGDHECSPPLPSCTMPASACPPGCSVTCRPGDSASCRCIHREPQCNCN